MTAFGRSGEAHPFPPRTAGLNLWARAAGESGQGAWSEAGNQNRRVVPASGRTGMVQAPTAPSPSKSRKTRLILFVLDFLSSLSRRP